MKPSSSVLAAALFAATALAASPGCSASSSPTGGAASGGASGDAAVLPGDAAAGAPADGAADAPWHGDTKVVLGPGADSSSPEKFAGPADPDAAPTLVYPDSGVIVPPNMNSLEFHFEPAAGQTLFELTFETPTLRLVVYVGCNPVGSGCAYTPDDAFWKEIADLARGAAPVKYRLRGVNGASPGPVGTSELRTISFTKEDIVGGLYYWNSAGLIERYDFGYPGKSAEHYVSAINVGALVCVGCHVMSRDGKQIAVGMDIPGPAPFKVLDVATRAQIVAQGTPLQGAANFFSFSPDGDKLLYSSGADINMMDTTDGSLLGQVVPVGTMPDWSPDGMTMVYARPLMPPPFGLGNPGVDSAGLELLTWDGSQWGGGKTLVQYQGENNYYPTFAPNGNWVLFNRSPSNQGSYSNTVDGELWTVAATGGKPLRLDAASDPGATQWPKWAPGIYGYGVTSGVFYFTFSSQRAYGLRLAAGEKTQLWMAAFDPARAHQGKDPSFPAFWLPFQDIATGNHIAQWVTSVEREPCTKVTDCEGNEVCDEGRCVPFVK